LKELLSLKLVRKCKTWSGGSTLLFNDMLKLPCVTWKDVTFSEICEPIVNCFEILESNLSACSPDSNMPRKVKSHVRMMSLVIIPVYNRCQLLHLLGIYQNLWHSSDKIKICTKWLERTFMLIYLLAKFRLFSVLSESIEVLDKNDSKNKLYNIMSRREILDTSMIPCISSWYLEGIDL